MYRALNLILLRKHHPKGKKILKKLNIAFSSPFRVYTSPCSDHIRLPEALLSRRAKAMKSTEAGLLLMTLSTVRTSWGKV